MASIPVRTPPTVVPLDIDLEGSHLSPDLFRVLHLANPARLKREPVDKLLAGQIHFTIRPVIGRKKPVDIASARRIILELPDELRSLADKLEERVHAAHALASHRCEEEERSKIWAAEYKGVCGGDAAVPIFSDATSRWSVFADRPGLGRGEAGGQRMEGCMSPVPSSDDGFVVTPPSSSIQSFLRDGDDSAGALQDIESQLDNIIARMAENDPGRAPAWPFAFYPNCVHDDTKQRQGGSLD